MYNIRSFSVTLVAATILVACATSPRIESDRWITGDAGLCERLIVAWHLKTAMLQDIVGANFTPEDEDANGEGQLQLSVMKCGASSSSESRMEATVVAHVMIPLAADRVPIMISGVSRDAWLSLPLTLVDSTSAVSELFSQHGYVVMDTDLAFEMSRSDNETSLHARLQFENGSISVFATVRGESEGHEISSALVGTGVDYYSAFFGKETALRYSSVSAAVRIEGKTVLSDLNLSETPAIALFDTQLESNRIFWHETLTAQ